VTPTLHKLPTFLPSFHSSFLTYSIAPSSRVLFEKLNDFQLVKKFPTLPHSQVPAIFPYPEPAQSSPSPHIPLPEDSSEYDPTIHASVSPVVSFPRVSPPKLSSPPHALHDPPTLHDQLKNINYYYYYYYYCYYLTAIQFTLGGGIPYTSPDQINKNTHRVFKTTLCT
jgi:hypothetical protein